MNINIALMIGQILRRYMRSVEQAAIEAKSNCPGAKLEYTRYRSAADTYLHCAHMLSLAAFDRYPKLPRSW